MVEEKEDNEESEEKKRKTGWKRSMIMKRGKWRRMIPSGAEENVCGH